MGWMDDFRNYLASEQGRRAAIQFGINLMQPIQPGQNWASHLAQAVGSVGEAEARAREQQLKDELLRRKLAGYDAENEYRNKSLSLKERAQDALEKYRQQQLELTRQRMSISKKLKNTARGMTREEFIAKNYKNFTDVTGEILPDAVERAGAVWDDIYKADRQKAAAGGTQVKHSSAPAKAPDVRYQGGTIGASEPAAVPNKAAIEHLLKTADNPKSRAAFDRIFGPGAADRILKEYGNGGGW